MDSFGENFDEHEVDPAADFLAREQNELAGLEDELKPVAPPVMNGTASDIGDLTGSVDLTNGIGQSERFDLSQMNDLRNPSPTPLKQPLREEPEKIKKWREEQKLLLEEKDKNEEIKKEEWRAAAKRELEEWYKHHEELIAKTKAANRNAEKQFVADTGAIEPGTEWERIAKLCDFNPKSSRTSKDVSRMRSIILQLKQTPLHSTKQA